MAVLHRRLLTVGFSGLLFSLVLLASIDTVRQVNSQTPPEEVTIRITESGFSPATVELLEGAQVIWQNDTSEPLTLTTGEFNALYLPLVTNGGTLAESAGDDGITAAAAVADNFSVTLAPGATFTYLFTGEGVRQMLIPNKTFLPGIIRILRTVTVRGYIAVAVNQVAGVPANLARDIYLPQVKVYLKNTVTGALGDAVLTDLSGRFTLHARRAGRYQICWEKTGYLADCTQEIYPLFITNLHVSKLRIQAAKEDLTTLVYGNVTLRDGSRPRLLEPVLNANAFADVTIFDSAGVSLTQVAVNNFGEYVLPQTPVRAKLTLQAMVEAGIGEQPILPEANLANAPFHAIDLTIANYPPRLEPLVPQADSGRFIRAAQPGDVINMAARSTDPDGDPLQYRWLLPASGGTLDSETNQSVKWTLPGTPGTYVISVVVFDGKGGYARAELPLRVDTLGVPFSGKVDATDASFVAGAEVEVNGDKTNTDGQGRFQLRVPEADRFVLNIRKAGYGLVSRIYDKAVTDGRWTLTLATVMSVDPTTDFEVFDRRDKRNCPGPAADQLNWRDYIAVLRNPQWQDGKGNVVLPFGDLAVPLPNPQNPQRECGPGIRVKIPANSLQDSSGNPPAGMVDVTLATVDLASPEQMPGDYTVLQPDNSTQVMQSYGAGMVEITGGGQEYNLKPGATAELTIPVDPTQLAAGGALPPTIPLLYYDEQAGVWHAEGTLTLVGTTYVATVQHFSTINADLVKTDQSCLRVLSPSLPPTYKLEITIPMGAGAAPKVMTQMITNVPTEHVIYNLPANVNVVLVPIRIDNNTPIGTFVVNTGGAQNPTNPNLPAGPPYVACATQVTLSELVVPDVPVSGEFLHGLTTFAATNLDELNPAIPAQNALKLALDQATTDYYAEVDPRGRRQTLADFRTANGFGVGEVEAIYANGGDLGFGRDMHCMKQLASDGQFDIACYVTNYGSNTTPDGQDVLDAIADTDPVATVAMEWSRIEDPLAPGDPPNAPLVFGDPQRVVKFFVYDGAGAAFLNAANLDGLGARPIPQLCMVCHGGEYSGAVSGGVPSFSSRNDVKLGSQFIPFDLQFYTFGPAPRDKATQQPIFKTLNEEYVLATTPNSAIQDIITEMYAGGPIQDEDFAVLGWQAQPSHEAMYKNVVAPTCRMCHASITVDPTLRFNTATQAINRLGQIESRVCAQHVMPHAQVTHELFWTSVGPHMPAQLQAFGDTFGTVGNGWQGNVCGEFTPGGSTPVTVYQSTIQPIWNANCTACHVGGTPSGGLNLATNSHANLVNVNSTEVPALKRVLPGDAANSYLYQKVTENSPAVGSKMPPGGSLSGTDTNNIQTWINDGAAP